MGMFDSAMFDCPNCSAVIDVQSKAGDCVLAEYPSDRIPAKIAADIDGEIVSCPKCDGTYTVSAMIKQQYVAMELV